MFQYSGVSDTRVDLFFVVNFTMKWWCFPCRYHWPFRHWKWQTRLFFSSLNVQVGANGRAFTTIHYPSMQEIWPALYSTNNIRVVEVRRKHSSFHAVNFADGHADIFCFGTSFGHSISWPCYLCNVMVKIVASYSHDLANNWMSTGGHGSGNSIRERRLSTYSTPSQGM